MKPAYLICVFSIPHPYLSREKQGVDGSDYFLHSLPGNIEMFVGRSNLKNIYGYPVICFAIFFSLSAFLAMRSLRIMEKMYLLKII